MIALVAAVSRNGVIGRQGRIPWYIENEQKRFKSLTVGNVVIMGRRTYQEIGRPLPNRTTIVISSTENFDSESCITVSSLEEALTAAKGRDIFISGGEGVYRAALPLADKLYLTEVDIDVDGDTFFPVFDSSEFIKTTEAEVSGQIPYRYVTYTRIRR